MTSPPEQITVCCPHCRLFYETWWRPSINVTLDAFDQDYIDEASSATCPRCAAKLSLPSVMNADGALTFAEPAWELPASTPDFLSYYDQERYLFEVVTRRFQRDQRLSAFDFFYIVIWKANRAKSRIAEKLLKHEPGYGDLESAVRALFAELATADDSRSRFEVFMNWGFRVPMASAILTVLYPNDFTVYDSRVCECLNDFRDIPYLTTTEAHWNRYSAYLRKVREAVPQYPRLRDKDRFLWGKSFSEQLEHDVKTGFGKTVEVKQGRI